MITLAHKIKMTLCDAILVSIIMLRTLNGVDLLYSELLARNTLSSNYSLFYNGNCIVAGETFALYSLICRYAKVSLTPNQQVEDKEVSNYQLDVPNWRLKRASFIKSMLESNQILKYFILFMTMLGTSMAIGDDIFTQCISGTIEWYSWALLISLLLVKMV